MSGAKRPARRGRPETTRDAPALGRDGERVELLVGGIAYSSYHPDSPWSGYVWDALAATALLLPRERPRVLLLGCAGGTVLWALRRLRPRARLTAVDVDRRVLDIARRELDLDSAGAEVVESDGPSYLRGARRRFDLVLDDMYAPRPGGLRRPVSDETQHLALVASRLAPGGLAGTNVTTDDDPPGLPARVRRAYRRTFPHRAKLRPRLGMNVVLVGSDRPLDLAGFRSRLAALAGPDRGAVGSVRVGGA